MEFGKEEKTNKNLEHLVDKKDLMETVDSKVIRDETATQTVLKNMFGIGSNDDKSDLMFEEVGNLTALKLIVKKFDIPSGWDLINGFLTFRISLDRKGRGEGFGAVKDENVNNGNLINKIGLLGKSF